VKHRIRGLVVLVLIAVAGILISLFVDQEPIKSLLAWPVVRFVVKLVGMAFSAGAGVFSYYRSEKRHQDTSIVQAREKARVHLTDMLVSAIQNMFIGETPQTIRANIMLAEGDELHMLASANMDVFPDFKVHLRKGQGCAGLAWKRAVSTAMNDCWRPVLATQAQLTRAQLRRRWNLSDDQVGKTSHILWILSIPLFLNAGSTRSFVGVLNFDGVHKPLNSPHRLRHPDFIGACVAFGDNVIQVAGEAMLLPGQIDSRMR
jgi:hypothetical protein